MSGIIVYYKEKEARLHGEPLNPLCYSVLIYTNQPDSRS